MADPTQPGASRPASDPAPPDAPATDAMQDELAGLVADDRAAAPSGEPDVSTGATEVQPGPAVQPPSYPPPPGPATEAPPAPVARPAQPAMVTATQVPAARRRRTWPRTLGRILALLFGVLQALLVLRIVLLLLIANQDNEIVAAILSWTDPFVEPFRGMFQLDQITGDRGSVLDIAAVVALIAWTLIESLVLALLRVFSRSSAEP